MSIGWNPYFDYTEKDNHKCAVLNKKHFIRILFVSTQDFIVPVGTMASA